jgi:hypothetical protein
MRKRKTRGAAPRPGRARARARAANPNVSIDIDVDSHNARGDAKNQFKSNPRPRRMVTLRNPLERGYSPATISANIEAEIRRGMAPDRAKAAAYREARIAFRRRHPHKRLPAYLVRRRARHRRHNPAAKGNVRYIVAGARKKGGPWVKFGEFDSSRYADPQGHAASAAKVLGKMGMYARVTRIASR